MRCRLINESQRNLINEMYNSFTRSCLCQNKEPKELKDEFLRLNVKHVKNGMGETFLYKSEKLSGHLLKNGKLKLANIFINELGKIYLRIGDVEQAEKTIRKSIKISALLNDNIHVLARLNDLEYLYKAINDKEKLFKILKEKKQCALEIINNYEKNAKNFNTNVKEPTSLESVKKQLAFTYSDMAELLLPDKPNESLKLIQKTKEIYEELGQKKEVDFLNVKMQIIKKRMNKSI